jgi:hypothetical protein
VVKAARAHDGASAAGVKSKIGALASEKRRRGRRQTGVGDLFTGTIAPAPASPGEEQAGRKRGARTEKARRKFIYRSGDRAHVSVVNRLKPQSFDQLKHDFPFAVSASREQGGLSFRGRALGMASHRREERKDLGEDPGMF